MAKSKTRAAVLALTALGVAGAGAGVLTGRGAAGGQDVAAPASGGSGPNAQAPRPSALPKGGGHANVVPDVERRLRLAFGDDCKDVLTAPIRVEFRSLQLVLAAGHFAIEPDGRGKFSPCWLARFGGGAAAPTTVCCDAAYFTFDGPVPALADIAGRKVLAVEPRGGVRIGFGPPAARPDIERQCYSRLREHGRLELVQGRWNLTVRSVDGKRLVQPVIKLLDSEGQVEFVVTAREGELLRVDERRRMLLLRLRSGVAEGRDGTRADFEEVVREIPLRDLPDCR